MMSPGHELGESWVAEDGVVWQADVGDIEVDELGAVVVACPEGDREADLPNWNCGAVGDSGERLGWLKLIVRHLEIVECLYGQDVEPWDVDAAHHPRLDGELRRVSGGCHS